MSTLLGAARPHPAIARALRAYPDGVRGTAEASLGAVLRERVAADGARAWSGSRLTGDGFPLEVNFATTDQRLRCTVEPASVDCPPRERFQAALRTLASLAGQPVPEDVADTLRRTQLGDGLRFGAWLGCRYGPGAAEYKLYAEAAPDATAPPELAVSPRLPDRAVRLRMLAYTPGSARFEPYFRVPSLEPHHLPRLLAPAGLEGRTGELLAFVAEAYGFPLSGRLPGDSVGLSYAMASTGDIGAVTLFFFARVFWGSDARIRERFGAVAGGLGWDTRPYRAVTVGATGRGRNTCHGILGITLCRDGGLALSIGVRPPGGPR
jgi:hypothetical protein